MERKKFDVWYAPFRSSQAENTVDKVKRDTENNYAIYVKRAASLPGDHVILTPRRHRRRNQHDRRGRGRVKPGINDTSTPKRTREGEDN